MDTSLSKQLEAKALCFPVPDAANYKVYSYSDRMDCNAACALRGGQCPGAVPDSHLSACLHHANTGVKIESIS
jgi:hypothetical protein